MLAAGRERTYEDDGNYEEGKQGVLHLVRKGPYR